MLQSEKFKGSLMQTRTFKRHEVTRHFLIKIIINIPNQHFLQSLQLK